MNAPAKQASRSPANNIKDKLLSGGQLEAVLPPHVTMERFAQVVSTAIASSKDLQEAAGTTDGQRSILLSCVQCATDGLIPDGREAALVVFNNKIKGKNGERDRWVKMAQYMPMVGGVVKRMQQSPDTKVIDCAIVYENELEDRFVYRRSEAGTEFRHEPIIMGDKGKPMGAYASMLTKDGGFYIAFCDLDEINLAKKASKGGQYGPWNGDFKLAMWKKTALKRLAKVAPVSNEVHALIDYDNKSFFDMEPAEPKKKLSEKLRDALPEPEPEQEALPEEQIDEPEAEDKIIDADIQELPMKPPVNVIDTDKGALAWAESFIAYYLAIPPSMESGFVDEMSKGFALLKDKYPKLNKRIFDEALNAKEAK